MQGSDSRLYVAYVLAEALGETEIQEARLGEPWPWMQLGLSLPLLYF